MSRRRPVLSRSLHVLSSASCASQNGRQHTWRYVHEGLCSPLYRRALRFMLARTRITENRLHTPAAAARAMSDVGNNTADIDEYQRTENDRYLERVVVPSVLAPQTIWRVYIRAIWRRCSRVTDISRVEDVRVIVRAEFGRVIRYGQVMSPWV